MNKITHINVNSVADAAAALAKGKAEVIAGGTDLTCSLKGMISPNLPATIVNIKTISGLDTIREDAGVLKIGALVTLTAIANNSIVKEKYTALAQAALSVGSPELRNMGTIGGNICQRPRCIYYRNEFNDFPCLRKNAATGTCYALLGVNRYHSIFGALNGCVAVCPSDTAVALVALNAKIVTNKNSAGWAAADFFGMPSDAGVRREQINNMASDEIVTEIQIPAPVAGTKSAYKKFAFRKAIDFPLVSAAVVATVSGGNVTAASIVLGGVYNTPRVATQAQTAIVGKAINAANATEAGNAAATGAVSLPQNNYKIQISKVMVKRAIEACA